MATEALSAHAQRPPDNIRGGGLMAKVTSTTTRAAGPCPTVYLLTRLGDNRGIDVYLVMAAAGGGAAEPFVGVAPVAPRATIFDL